MTYEAGSIGHLQGTVHGQTIDRDVTSRYTATGNVIPPLCQNRNCHLLKLHRLHCGLIFVSVAPCRLLSTTDDELGSSRLKLARKQKSTIIPSEDELTLGAEKGL